MERTALEHNLAQYEKALRDAFPGLVGKAAVQNERELHLEVPVASIRPLAAFVNGPLAGALLTLFACDERERTGTFRLRYVFGCGEGALVILSAQVLPDPGSFPSVSDLVHAAATYEREIQDLFGLIPAGHPDARPLVFHGNWPHGSYPLRRDYDKTHRPPFAEGVSAFRTIGGDGVYEIPVGPVHAGIIEPGHFRFSLAGEPIQNLEAQLYFTHKGIEKLAEGMSPERGFYLSERISGDETFTNSLAYCLAVEQIAGVAVPARGSYLRVFYGELERLTCHMNDLIGICLDVAYGFGAFQLRLLRNWCYQLAELCCGSRFLRSVNQPGGIRFSELAGKETEILRRLSDLARELSESEDILRRQTMLTDRIENTGVLLCKTAFDLHAVGPGARASGIPGDVRKTLPYAAYGELNFDVPVYSGGDVACRMNVKLQECFQSIRLMTQVIERMPAGPCSVPVGTLPAFSGAFGITEAPRGENVHWVEIGEDGTILRYKVRTPSFCNWPALCHAVRGNIVPDFPLINKSFNLSYAGNDL